MWLLSFGTIGLCVFIYYFPNYYLSELGISFLPYFMVLNLLFFIFWIWRFNKFNSKNIKKLIIALFILLHGFVFFTFSREFNQFYVLNLKLDKDPELRLFYANIHKNNDNYEDIKASINKYNPDLIMFVEFGEDHYKNLKDFLQEKYPYINSTTWSKKFIWSMVFSKYELKNRADDFSQWSWRYAYFQLNLGNKDYYIYLVHSSSPDSYNHYLMRNQQLQILSDDFNLHKDDHRDNNDNVLIVGDFNVSPRSIVYKNFENWLWTGFVNITRKKPVLFTWYLYPIPIFWSHIDHIWTNISVENLYMESFDLIWSDHRALLLDIWV
jgi:endonuclease/exonuclease/phosphatase (EEP) superfamily protein YafD